MKTTSLVFLMIFLGACTLNKGVSPSTKLDSNIGIMVTKLSCGGGIWSAEFYKSNTKVPNGLIAPLSARSGYIACNNKEYQSVEIPAGNYYWGLIVTTAGPIKYLEKSALKFTVFENKVNYIGDINFASKQILQGNTNTIHLSNKGPISIDNTEIARKYFLEKHPNIVKQYGFSTNLASR